MYGRLGLLLLAMLLLALSACGGSATITPPPAGFDRLTAQVLDAKGAPLAGLAVRVEGADTGLTTDGAGGFTLLAANFPNGVDASNEISLGRNGVVVATEDVIPSADPDLTIALEGDGGTGSVSGNAVNKITGGLVDGVQVTLFSLNGGVYQDTTVNGAYSFTGVGTGSWQLVAYAQGYNPGMAFVNVTDGQQTTMDIPLSPDGQVAPGDGIKVRGHLTNSKTGAPIEGAFISLMADTGYVGIEPWLGMPNADGTLKDSPPPSTGGDAGGAPTDVATGMPFYYDPQYQETTTAADGSFEFTNDVVGLGLYLNYSAEAYLSGYQSVDISGRSDDLDLDLTLEPLTMTSAKGVVKDQDGAPVEGAYVEFIFAGQTGIPMPMYDNAMPPTMDLNDMAQAGAETRDNTGNAPPPRPEDPATSGGSGDSGGVPAAGGAPGSPSGPNMDNEWMQKFRFENQTGHGTSDVGFFNGYYSATTGADGKFNFAELPAGQYYVCATAYKHLPFSNTFEVDEDPAQNDFLATVPEIPVGSVEGTVTDENGDPLPDVLVNATQPYVDPFTYSDASGHYRIDNVPAGQWIISGFKNGYITASHDTEISENSVAHVDLALTTYTAPATDTVIFSGRVVNGGDIKADGTLDTGSGVSGADMVFTPTEAEFGGYYRHIQSGSGGAFSTDLIPASEYNVLIQAPDFQDVYMRVYVDSSYPQMDFYMWPASGGPGGGGWGGGVIMPPVPGSPTNPDDPSGGGGSSEPGRPGGGGGSDPGDDPTTPPEPGGDPIGL